MAHTIFHSPNRQQTIKLRTPQVSVEASRRRRQAARRAVLTSLYGTREESAPKAAQDTSTAQRGEGNQQSSMFDNTSIGKLRNPVAVNPSFQEFADYSRQNMFAASQFGGLLGMVNPALGLIGTLAPPAIGMMFGRTESQANSDTANIATFERATGDGGFSPGIGTTQGGATPAPGPGYGPGTGVSAPSSDTNNDTGTGTAGGQGAPGEGGGIGL